MGSHVSALFFYFAFVFYVTAEKVTFHHVFVGDELLFTCLSPNNSNEFSWVLRLKSGSTIEVKVKESASLLPQVYTADENATASWFTFEATSNHAATSFACKSNGVLLYTYDIERVLDISNFINPRCNIAPVLNGNTPDVIGIEYSCRANSSQEISPTLNLQGLDSTADGFVVKNVTVDDFTRSPNVSCELSVFEKKNFRSCTFPDYVEVRSSCKQETVIVECNIDEDSEIKWYFLNADTSKNDVSNPWFKNNGKTLLLRNVSTLEINRVIVCQEETTNNSITKIGFGNISCLQSSRESPTTPKDHGKGDSKVFVWLTYIMVCIWLGTLGVIICWCGHSTRNKKHSTGYGMRVPSSSRGTELTSNSGEGAVPTRVDINKIRESNNKNNSALHHDDKGDDVYEGIAIGAGKNKEDTSSDDCDRLYFCLEPTSSTRSSVGSDHGKETAVHLDERHQSVESLKPKPDSNFACYEEVKTGTGKSTQVSVNLREAERRNEELFPIYSTVNK